MSLHYHLQNANPDMLAEFTTEPIHQSLTQFNRFSNHAHQKLAEEYPALNSLGNYIHTKFLSSYLRIEGEAICSGGLIAMINLRNMAYFESHRFQKTLAPDGSTFEQSLKKLTRAGVHAAFKDTGEMVLRSYSKYEQEVTEMHESFPVFRSLDSLLGVKLDAYTTPRQSNAYILGSNIVGITLKNYVEVAAEPAANTFTANAN